MYNGINVDRILNRAMLKTNSENGWYMSNICRCRNKLLRNELKKTSLEYLLLQEIKFLEIILKKKN